MTVLTAADAALIQVQADISGHEAVKAGIPIGAQAQWNIIAVANADIAATGVGDLTLAAAQVMEPAYRQLGVLYGLVDGANFIRMADGLAAWISVVGAPTLPTAPITVAATPGDGSMTISWQPPTYNGGTAITGYKVTRLDTGAVQSVGAGSLSFTYSLLTNGTTYSFNVRASNAQGDSIPSATVTGNPAGVARRYDFGPGADAPAATWLAAPVGTTSLGTYTDTTDPTIPIEFRSGIYGLDPGAGFGIPLPLEVGDWVLDFGMAEWTFQAANQRVTDLAIITNNGSGDVTWNLARNVDPFAQHGYATPFTLSFVIHVPSGGHPTTVIMPERLSLDHGLITAITATSIPVGSQALSPNVPIPGGGGAGGGGAGLAPLGNSTQFKAKTFIDTHWRYTNIPYYANIVNFTANAKSITGGNIRDDCPGKIINGDQSIGQRFWQWVVDNQMNVIYVSTSTAFGITSSHAVNRQVLDSVPGAAARVVAIEMPNELDFQIGDVNQRKAEVAACATAFAGFPLMAPSVGDWRNTTPYNVFANDSRFTYGNDHSYTGFELYSNDAMLAQAVSNSSIIVGNRPKACTECGHGTYTGGIGPDGTTGPNTGNPPVTETQQADSYLREWLDRDRYGYAFVSPYECGDETAVNNYETRLGVFHLNWTEKESGTALRNLRGYYSSDPAAITNCPVTLGNLSTVTRYNLRQRNGAWLMAFWEQGNTAANRSVTLTFPTSRTVVQTRIRDNAAVSTTTGTSHTVVSGISPVMCVIS